MTAVPRGPVSMSGKGQAGAPVLRLQREVDLHPLGEHNRSVIGGVGGEAGWPDAY